MESTTSEQAVQAKDNKTPQTQAAEHFTLDSQRHGVLQCPVCGERRAMPDPWDSKPSLCDQCFCAETYLARYLRFAKGRKRLRRALRRADRFEAKR